MSHQPLRDRSDPLITMIYQLSLPRTHQPVLSGTSRTIPSTFPCPGKGGARMRADRAVQFMPRRQQQAFARSPGNHLRPHANHHIPGRGRGVLPWRGWHGGGVGMSYLPHTPQPELS